MAAARAKKEKPAPGPDDLVRESAGTYRTGDGRFEVQKSDQGWFLIDTHQANEFGQQLIHGAFPTLDALREAVPGARDLKPLLRTRVAKTSASKPDRPNPAKQPASPPPPPPPKSWIDKLPAGEAAEVRKLIRALEKEGLDDAQTLVRRHRDAPTPVLATLVIEHRLRALVSEWPEEERERAHDLVRRVTQILASDGNNIAPPGPRWVLVEIRDDDLPPRRISPRP